MTKICTRLTAGAVAAALAISSLATTPARAEEDPLKAAEAAYQKIDFDGTLENARKALKAGGNEPKRVARIYYLLGLAHATKQNPDEARDAFVRMIAIAPDMQIEKSLSPRLRSPYLEARGYWASRPEKLGAEPKLNVDDSKLIVGVTDPASMVDRVRVRTRLKPGGDYREAVEKPGDEVVVTVPGLAQRGRVQFNIALLDEHGNVLWRSGTDGAPEALGTLRQKDAAGPRRDRTPARPADGGSDPTPFHVLAGTAAALGVISIGVAVPFHLKRESEAKDWNGAECEQAVGQTRAEQCGDVDDRRESAEQRAVLFYALGSALVTAGFITWLAAPSSKPEKPAASAGVRCGAGLASVACAGRF